MKYDAARIGRPLRLRRRKAQSISRAVLTAAAAIAAVAAVAAVASSPSSRSTLFVVLALQLAVVALLLPWGEEAVDLIGHCVDAVEDGGPGRDPRAMDALY